ncbi:hypothetical protein HWV62_12717 [Athelia sp. TMB]|nr:hypothetical protein HWV62_12717 [Athelia sp. TMB]
MVAFTPLTFVSLAFIASSVTATSPMSNALLSLSKRQTGVSPSDFPPACQSGCGGIANIATNCESASDMLSCVCSSTNIAMLQSCVNCIVSSETTAAVIAAGQAVAQEYNTECAGKGAPSLTVPASGAAGTVPAAGPTSPVPVVGPTTGTTAAASSTSTTESGGSSSPFKNGASANAAMGVAGLMGMAVFGFAATAL